MSAWMTAWTTAWWLVDGMALLLAGAYGLSLPLAWLPLPAADARAQAREAGLRLAFPLLGSAMIVASGAGSTAWDAWRRVADHCGDALVHRPYFCGLHPARPDLAGGELVTGALLLATAIAAGAGLLRAARADRDLRRLAATSDPAAVDRARRRLAAAGAPWAGRLAVVPSDEALCFVFGPAAPTLVLSDAVVDRLPAPALAAMVAHERAHLARRDLVRRPLARLARLFHLPGLGARAYARWVAAGELACDAIAGEALGSRSQVAEALIAFQRLRLPARPVPATVAFADASLRARVERLVGPAAGPPHPAWRAWPAAFALATVLAAPALHRGLEALLRLLHA